MCPKYYDVYYILYDYVFVISPTFILYCYSIEVYFIHFVQRTLLFIYCCTATMCTAPLFFSWENVQNLWHMQTTCSSNNALAKNILPQNVGSCFVWILEQQPIQILFQTYTTLYNHVQLTPLPHQLQWPLTPIQQMRTYLYLTTSLSCATQMKSSRYLITPSASATTSVCSGLRPWGQAATAGTWR